MANRRRPKENWELLYESNDLYSEFSSIYEPKFFEELALYFDKKPTLEALAEGTYVTVSAYVLGMRQKLVSKTPINVFSYRYVVDAGRAAENLQEALRLLENKKSTEAFLFNKFKNHIENTDGRGKNAHQMASQLHGPKDPFAAIREMASALSGAVNEILATQVDEDEYASNYDLAYSAFQDIEKDRRLHAKSLSAHHALEKAAAAFQPMWEENSSKRFTRGYYRHDSGGYVSKATDSLYQIISKIDSNVAKTLVGTSIENVRKNSDPSKT